MQIVEKYHRLENEKKNARTVRKTNVGPMIRYQSLSMPLMVLSNSNKEKEKEKENEQEVKLAMETDVKEDVTKDAATKSTDTGNKWYEANFFPS